MKDDEVSFRQIKLGGLINYLLIGANILLGLVYTPWILHEIGSSNYGLYTLANSLIALFLMDFGMSAAVTRFVSNYRAEGNQGAIDSFVGLAIKFYVFICTISALVLLIIYLNIDALYANLTSEELAIFRIVYIISALFIVTCFPVNICNGVLNAYEEFIWLRGTDILNRFGTVVVTIIALMLNGGIIALVFISGFFNLLTFALKAIVMKKRTPVRVNLNRTENLKLRDIFSFSLWSTVNGMSQQLMFNIIPNILGNIANTMAITLYGFANVIEGYVYTISSGLNGLFMPKVSRILVKSDDYSSVLPLMIKVGRINLSIVGLLLIGLTVFGKEFVRLWVGNEYESLYYCILFLSLPYFVSATQQIGNTCITVVNKVKYSALIGVGSSLLNVVMCVVLCSKYGVVGVCAGTCLSFVVRIIFLNVLYHRDLKIDIFLFFKECHLKMAPAIIVASSMAFLLAQMWENSHAGLEGWLLLGVRAVITSVVYAICMWVLGWNDYEKELIRGMRRTA